jgi:iron-sulfur cluster repair protein YtfE (RIC family)
VRGEERVLFPVLERFTSVSSKVTTTMRNEHRSLRGLVDTIGELIARADRRRGLELLATLRSVLLLHVAKEEWVLFPLIRPVASPEVLPRE